MECRLKPALSGFSGSILAHIRQLPIRFLVRQQFQFGLDTIQIFLPLSFFSERRDHSRHLLAVTGNRRDSVLSRVAKL